MRSRSTISVSALFAPLWLVVPLCLVGCSCFRSFHPVPLPMDLTPEGVQDQVFTPVTLDQVALPTEEGGRTRTEVKFPGCISCVPPPAPALLPPGGDVFTLPQAVAFGLKFNPRLLSALAAIERARGQEQVAFAPFLPEIDLLTHSGVTSPKLGPASAGQTGIIIPTNIETHSYAQAELQVQWTICDFGRTAGRFQQAGARTHIAELQSLRMEQTIGYSVATAYLQALRARAARLIQEEASRRAQAILRDTRSRRAAGVVEKDAVLRAQVQLAAAAEDVDIAGLAERQALAQLNNAMGRNASLPLIVVAVESGEPDQPVQPAFHFSLLKCLQIAADQRPEIGVAREAAAAALYGKQATAAEFLPRVYALASVGDLAGSNIANGSQEGAGLHIDLPLSTGGRRKGELRAADAEVQQTIGNARTILDGVTLQVTLAYLSATTARRRIELDRPAIEEARENLRMITDRYRNGNATPTDVVDAETALVRAQQRLVSASNEYLAALVSLDFALGNPPGHLLGAPPDHPVGEGGKKTKDEKLPETLPEPRREPQKQ